MSDRFDFEQEIMGCWSIIDDINILLKRLNEDKIKQEDSKEYLSSLKTIYQVKFEQMFETFEDLIKKGYIK